MPTRKVPFCLEGDLWVTMQKPNRLVYFIRQIALWWSITSWKPWRWRQEGYLSPLLACQVAGCIHGSKAYRDDVRNWFNAPVFPGEGEEK